MEKLASVNDIKPLLKKAPVRKTSLKKLAFLSKENIEKRKARENGNALTISSMSPLTESDVKPLMPEHENAADKAVGYVYDSMNHIRQKFSGVRIYALTEAAVQQSVERVTETIFQEKVTKELVNTLMSNMDAHKIFSEKLTRVRMATLNQDTAVLVDELLEFVKFFDTDLWGKLNIVSEKIWDRTGFAIGKFTSDFHLKWMRLLQDQFVQSIMGAVAEAAKSLASYKSIQAEFIQKRKDIEGEISKAPVLEKIRRELDDLYTQQAQALNKCKDNRDKLKARKNNPKSSIKITEEEIESARALANDLDYRIEQAITRDSAATESVLTADESADVAKLPGIAIQMHVRAIADLFFNSGMFVLNTAAFFAVRTLLESANQANEILQKGRKVAASHDVNNDINRLSDAAKNRVSNEKVQTGMEKSAKTADEMKTAMKKIAVKAKNAAGEEVYELIWVCFQILIEDKTCVGCSESIAKDQMVARPHYPCKFYSGEPETIHGGERTVVEGVYICHDCLTKQIELLAQWQREGRNIIHPPNFQ